MAYCTIADVQAAAPRGALDDLTDNPTIAEVQGFIDDCAALIDAAITGHGYTAPTTVPVVVEALRPVNVDGALVKALDAAYDHDSESPARAAAHERWMAAVKALRAGTHEALLALASESSADRGATAGSFLTSQEARDLPDWNTQPTIYRGMQL